MRLTALIALTAAASAQAAIDLGSLAKNSPFGGSATTATPIVSIDTGGLELRGMYVDQGKTYFSIYNATTKQSTWVAQGELPSKASADLGVRAFDVASGIATVDAGSRTVQLPLKQASIAKYEAPVIVAQPAEGAPPSPFGQPGADGKVQTPWGSFTPEQIAAFRAEREKRWAERMNQAQQEGKPGEGGADAAPARGGEAGGRGGRGSGGGRGGRGG